MHVSTETKETGGSLHQRVVRWEGHAACLHQFDYLVFLAFVFQFQVLRVEIEGRIRVIAQVHVHLVAHLSVHAQVYLLVEVQAGGPAVSDGQRGVVCILQRGSELELCRALGLDSYTAGAENLLCRTQTEVHVHKVELIFTLVGSVLSIFLVEELV